MIVKPFPRKWSRWSRPVIISFDEDNPYHLRVGKPFLRMHYIITPTVTFISKELRFHIRGAERGPLTTDWMRSLDYNATLRQTPE